MDESAYPTVAKSMDRHWWFTGRREIFRAALRKLTDMQDGLVLDVGCGTGSAYPLLKEFGTVIGVDNNHRAIEFAKQRGYKKVIIGDACDLPLDNEQFDLVVALDLIEHLSDEKTFIDELVRVLKPGGVLFVTTAAIPVLWSGLDELSHHVRRYTRETFTQALKHPVLEPRLIRYYNFVFFFPILVARLLERAKIWANVRPRSLHELEVPPPPLNSTCRRVLALERYFLTIPLPVGVSLFGIYVKNV